MTDRLSKFQKLKMFLTTIEEAKNVAIDKKHYKAVMFNKLG